MLAFFLWLACPAGAVEARVSPPDAHGVYVVQFARRFVREDDPSFAREQADCLARLKKKGVSDCMEQGRVGAPSHWLVVGQSSISLRLDPGRGRYDFSDLENAKEQRFDDGRFDAKKLPAKALSDAAASDRPAPAPVLDALWAIASRAEKRAKPRR